MNFACNYCANKYFKTNGEAIKHLKIVHKVKEKVDQIKCTVKNSECNKYFQTFSGLARHITKCLSQNKTEIASSDLPENIRISENEISKRNHSFIFNESDRKNDLSSSSVAASRRQQNSSIVFDEEDEGAIGSFKENLNQTFVFNCSDPNVLSPDEITRNFLISMTQLNLNEKTMNDIFHLTETLLKKTHEFCQQSMKTNKDVSPSEVICDSMNVVSRGLQRFDSSYKRKMFFESQPSFLRYNPVAIGTHWETERDKKTKLLEQTHKQSVFSFISPLDIIKKLFEKPNFRDTYFEYNEKNRHVCEPNVYQDFCCGSIYKKVDFFKMHPNCLQLQFFVDGFEVCSALKTKTTLHSQVAVYMTIRNMPPRFAYNMSNIFLVCLVNENDLKKTETDYTNLLEQIVKDIKILETSGINLGKRLNLKGKRNQKLQL